MRRDRRMPNVVLHLLDGKCVNRRRTTHWLVGHESSPEYRVHQPHLATPNTAILAPRPMGARAFHPKPPRNRRLNEAWAGNILPFPRKSPDFFWSPYPSHPPTLSVRPLAVSFRSSSPFLSRYIRSIGPRSSSSFLPSSSVATCVLHVTFFLRS